MKRIAILVFLQFPLLFAYSSGVLYDRDQIRMQSLQKLVETEESFDVARIYYNELIQIAEANSDERTRAECLFQVSRIYYWQMQLSLSLAEAKKGLTIARRLDDTELQAVGYDMLARLHYLFSPEQAQYYYRKCWQYCKESDSVEMVISNLNSYHLVRVDDDMLLDDLLSINIHSLSQISRAWLGYNIARSMISNGRLDDALGYLEYARDYLQSHRGASPLNAMYEYRLAQISMLKGDTQHAWTHWNKSLEIVRKSNILMGVVDNYRLASDIAKTEGKEIEALDFYKKSIVLRDSIFNCVSNRYFPDDLIYTMMENLAEDESQTKRKVHIWGYILLALALFAGMCLLYYFKSDLYRKKTKTTVIDMKKQSANGIHSRLKNHLMKIMYGYKAGANHCLKYALNIQGQSDELSKVNYSDILEKNKQKANQFMDTLFDWVESKPDMQPVKVNFDVGEMIEQVIALYKIASASKHIKYQLSIGERVLAYGDRNMLSIAIEHLFFKIVKSVSEDTTIMISVQNENNGYVAICIFDPGNSTNMLEKGIFAQRITELGTSSHEVPQTVDWDFNIFAVCTMRNSSKITMESTLQGSTIYRYCIPAV